MKPAVVLVLALVACTDRAPQVAPEPVNAQPVAPEPVNDRFARAEDEWQAMRPDREQVWPCMPDRSCGQARACIDGQCLPCLQDGECLPGERCVLEHCLRAELVGCTRRRDCGKADAMCVMSGYTSLDVRANADLRSYCLSPGDQIGPTEAERLAEAEMQAANVVPAEPTGPTPGERLLEQLRARARRRAQAGP